MYLSLERCKTAQFDQLLAEQSKERVERKLIILEKSFELKKKKLLEEAFKAESKVRLATLEKKKEIWVLIAMKVSQCWPTPYLK